METVSEEIPRCLVLNRVKCLECGEVLTSEHRHDYKVCSCPNKTSTDGGLAYLRWGAVVMDRVQHLSVYNTDDFELVRQSFTWGTYGKKGDKPLKYVRLDQMSDSHIANILAMALNPVTRDLFKKELNYRAANNITVDDSYGE